MRRWGEGCAAQPDRRLKKQNLTPKRACRSRRPGYSHTELPVRSLAGRPDIMGEETGNNRARDRNDNVAPGDAQPGVVPALTQMTAHVPAPCDFCPKQ